MKRGEEYALNSPLGGVYEYAEKMRIFLLVHCLKDAELQLPDRLANKKLPLDLEKRDGFHLQYS